MVSHTDGLSENNDPCKEQCLYSEWMLSLWTVQ